MNIYFIDPTYVKDDAWDSLLDCLGVKAGFSLVPEEDILDGIMCNLRNRLLSFKRTSFVLEKFDRYTMGDECTFWLREQIEQNVPITKQEIANCEGKPRGRRLKDIFDLIRHDLAGSNLIVLLYLDDSYFEYNGGDYERTTEDDEKEFFFALPRATREEYSGRKFMRGVGWVEYEEYPADFTYEKFDKWKTGHPGFDVVEQECESNGRLCSDSLESSAELRPIYDPANIIAYCLNILRKKHKHNLYGEKCNFVLFDKFMIKTCRYDLCRKFKDQMRCFVLATYHAWLDNTEQWNCFVRHIQRLKEHGRVSERMEHVLKEHIENGEFDSFKNEESYRDLVLYVGHAYSQYANSVDVDDNWWHQGYLLTDLGKQKMKETTRNAWVEEYVEEKENEMWARLEESAAQDRVWQEMMDREFWEECGEGLSDSDLCLD